VLNADLHLHTTYSPDGEWQVTDILKACKQAGLRVISVTDHNLVKAIPETLTAAPDVGMSVIPGIEIDCNYKGTDLHVLGYNIDWQSSDFSLLQQQIEERTRNAFDRMIINLHHLGIYADAQEVLNVAEGRLPSPELIGEVLLNNPRYAGVEQLEPYRTGGNRSDMPYLNVYLDLFAQGKPAYVKIEYMHYSEATALIKNNGGVSVVAHPGHNLKGSEAVVKELLQLGAEGLEAFNNYHSVEQIEYLAEIAVKGKVLMTCGSDFHGKNKPVIKLGQYRTIERYEAYVRESVEELLC